MSEPVGRQFVAAVAARDERALRTILAEDVDFRALTPRESFESAGIDGVVQAVFGRWIEPTDSVEGVLAVDIGPAVVDCERVGYRFRVRSEGDPAVYEMEQQAYYTCRDDRIVWLRVLCSGWRPLPVED
jgi:hypothetical protein